MATSMQYRKKRAFIREYYKREGVLLDEDNMNPNPAQRSLVKLLLNAL